MLKIRKLYRIDYTDANGFSTTIYCKGAEFLEGYVETKHADGKSYTRDLRLASNISVQTYDY